jgi:hypothetical protein
MAVDGKIKIFEPSMALYKDGATVATSSGTGGQYALSMNKLVKWESVGSNDSTTETMTITFDDTKTFSRIFIVDTNIKDFKIFYDTNQDFSTVRGINNASLTKIDVTDSTSNTVYYEFDEVSADNILIQMFNTQAANEEKYITIAIVTEEIGAFEGFPQRSAVNIKPNSKVATTETGKRIIRRGLDSFSAKLSVAYSLQADIDLLETLFDRDEVFLIWLHGGLTTSFNMVQRGWRLQDIYPVQCDNLQLNTDYRADVTTLSPEKAMINLVEVVG